MGWGSFGTGFALGGTLIIAIGAQNAFVLRQGLRREHVGAVVAFCAASDVLLMTAGVAGVGAALQTARALALVLTLGGVLFLLAYGALALRRALHPKALAAAADHAPMSLRSAATLGQSSRWIVIPRPSET